MRPREPRLDFERLYRSHRQEVYRVALRKLGDHHEAEDVTQATFLDAYRAVLRGTEPELPRAWLHAIAENVRRRRFRAARRRPREEPLRDSHPAEDSVAVALSADEIRGALATLAPSQRRAFLLRELGGLSYGEIASELGTTVAAVQMLVFRARQKLRRELEGPALGRLGGLVPIPHWFASLADRMIPSGSGVARVVGLAAAGAVAVGGGVTTDAPATSPGRAPAAAPPAAVAAATPRPVHAVAAQPGTVPAGPSPTRVVADTAVATSTVAQASTGRMPPRAGSVPAAGPVPGPAPEPEATVVPSADPVAPVAPPATPEEDDEAPAPALAPGLPPTVVPSPTLPVEAPVPPPPPALPVEGAVPALPGLPAVGEPPSLPAPPGTPGITVPELPVPVPPPVP